MTWFTYDALGNLKSAKNHLQALTQLEYDGNGKRTAEIDELNRRTSYE